MCHAILRCWNAAPAPCPCSLPPIPDTVTHALNRPPPTALVVLGVLMCVPGLPARAQPVTDLRTTTAPASPAADSQLLLADIYTTLLRRNPRIEAARQLARAASARAPGARRPPDPQLQLGFMNYDVPSFRPMEIVGMNQLQLMQMVPIPGKLGLAGTAADERASAELARASDVQWVVRARAAAAFYDLYQYEQSLVVATETRRLLQDLVRTVESMYGVGEGRQSDVLRAQVEVARASEEIVRLQSMRVAAAGRLNALLDRPDDAPLAAAALPAFPSTLPSLDSLQSAALSARPMIRATEAEVRATQAAERLAHREILPDLQVGVQYAQRPGVSGLTAGAASSGTDRMMSLMIGASIPIFARSRQLRMRDEAAAMRQEASAQLASDRAETRASVTGLHADLTRARNLQQLYRNTIIPQSNATVVSSLSAYRVGTLPFISLLESRTSLNAYRLELTNLAAEEGRAWAELEMLLGGALFDPARVVQAHRINPTEPRRTDGAP